MSTETAAVLHGPKDLRIEQLRPAPLGAGQVRVRILGVGLCGSDLHYYADGRNGTNTLRAPTVLGHEGFGVITEVGAGVRDDRIWQRVAIEPAAPCLRCPTCLGGRYNVCPNSTCLGSPPTHGLLRGSAAVPAPFAHPLPNQVEDAVAPLIEPLAVAWWAVHRVGPLTGKRVLVTGAGPIGLLVLQVARAAGAADVLVSDLSPRRLEAARTLGATDVLLVGRDEVGDVRADVLLECSGSPAALRQAAAAVAPGGIIGLVGVPGEQEPAFPTGLAQRWEFDVRGCFRYGPAAFAGAVALAGAGRVDLAALVTSRFPLAHAARALDLAIEDRTQLKVMIDTAGGTT